MQDEYLAIRQLAERYADAVNRRDAEAWGACWAPDGEWDLGGTRQVRGREQLVETWKGLMGNYPWVVQIVYSGVVEADGDSATARWYLQEYIRVADGTQRTGIGVYRDSCTRIDGRWYFARRRYDLLYSGSADLSGTASPFPS